MAERTDTVPVWLYSEIARRTQVNRNGCWEWSGSRNHQSYGNLMINYKNWRTHRLAWILWNGEIPDGLMVLHQCDNPPCCNPDHLFLGSAKDNALDAYAKGRMTPPAFRGENSGKSILTEAQAMGALISTLSAAKYAKQVGVAKQTILNVRQGKTWAHLPRGT